jgi:hypothetical protein
MYYGSDDVFGEVDFSSYQLHSQEVVQMLETVQKTKPVVERLQNFYETIIKKCTQNVDRPFTALCDDNCDKKYSIIWAELLGMSFTAVLMREMGKYCLFDTQFEEDTEFETLLINQMSSTTTDNTQLRLANLDMKTVIRYVSVFYLYGAVFNFKNAIELLPEKLAPENMYQIISCTQNLFEDKNLLDHFVFCSCTIGMFVLCLI